MVMAAARFHAADPDATMPSTPGARICRDWMRSNVRTASQRPQKIVSNKTGRKKIFSDFILALAESRGALLSLNGCDNVFRV